MDNVVGGGLDRAGSHHRIPTFTRETSMGTDGIYRKTLRKPLHIAEATKVKKTFRPVGDSVGDDF